MLIGGLARILYHVIDWLEYCGIRALMSAAVASSVGLDMKKVLSPIPIYNRTILKKGVGEQVSESLEIYYSRAVHSKCCIGISGELFLLNGSLLRLLLLCRNLRRTLATIVSYFIEL